MKLSNLILSGLVAVAVAGPGAAVAQSSLLDSTSAYDWSGLYAGVNLGYGSGSSQVTDASATNTDAMSLILPPGTFTSPDSTSSPRGMIGGLEAGYNQQFGNFVVGVEGDVQRTGIAASQSFSLGAPAPTQDNTLTLDGLGTLRGRAGIGFGNFIVYGTAGVAVGHVSASNTLTSGVDPSVVASDTDSRWMTGWTAGTGIEAALGDSGWTAKAEYLYVDLGRAAFRFNPAPGLTTSSNVAATANIFRAGLNYRF
jgi:outer membrane immunogenic protein